MKTILIFVSSLDGKITKWGAPNVKAWTSHQDQDYYRKVWNESELIVMGANTYRADQQSVAAAHHVIVLTRNPEKYKQHEVAGKLEFTKEDPSELVSRFEKQGYAQMLVAGGPQVATLFLKEQLIDELWLTLEPRIFGEGGNFAGGEKLDISLQLIHCEKVNEQGTLITKYAVIRK